MITQSHKLPDGREIKEITLQSGKLTAKILTFGAAVRDLRLAGHAAPLVLGYENISDYLGNNAYIGTIVGPVANRISNAAFEIDGLTYQLDANWAGMHTLHGGRLGSSHCHWDIVAVAEDHLTLGLTLADGHMGFPGPITLRCRYELIDEATLDIKLTAGATQPCFLSPAPHCYFNLDGRATVDAHYLTVPATHYSVTDQLGLPTGEIAPAAGSDFDFRIAKTANSADLDLNYCHLEGAGGLHPMAELHSQISGRSLTVLSDQPGLQVFNGAALEIAAKGLEGRRYGPFSGVAFEPQYWPDTPNQPHFPSNLFGPDKPFSSHSQFRFT